MPRAIIPFHGDETGCETMKTLITNMLKDKANWPEGSSGIIEIRINYPKRQFEIIVD